MKLGPHLDGTPEEIKDFVKSIDSEISQYLLPEAIQPTRTIWVIVPALIFALICVSLSIWIENLKENAIAVIVTTAVVGVWLVAVVHRKYQSSGVTWIVAIGCLTVLALAAHAVTLIQLLDRAREVKK